MVTEVANRLARFNPSRRAFVRLAAAGTAGLAALRFGLVTGRGADAADDLLLTPANPLKEGPFGEHSLRQRAAGLVPDRAAHYLDARNCWQQVADDLYAMSLDQRQAMLRAFFADFLHGEDYADFAFSLSQVDFSKPAQTAPTVDEAQAVAAWLSSRTNGSGRALSTTPISTATRVRGAGATLADVTPLSLLLGWEDAVAMRKEGPEFQDPEAVTAAGAIAVYAFGRAAQQLGPTAASERKRAGQPGATISGAAVELVMGGIQAIAYQDTFKTTPQAGLLARLAARGHLLVGTTLTGKLVFARIESLAGGRS